MELESEICNFADDTKIYTCDTHVEAVMIRLKGDLQGLMQRFTNNGKSRGVVAGGQGGHGPP